MIVAERTHARWNPGSSNSARTDARTHLWNLCSI